MDEKIENLNLSVVSVYHFNGYGIKNYKMLKREVYDYEIELFIESDGGVTINGKYVSFEKGNVNFRKPGQIVQGKAPYSCICIIFRILPEQKGEGRKQPLVNSLKNIPDKIEKAADIEKAIYRAYKENSNIFTKAYLYIVLGEMQKAAESESLKKDNIYIYKALKYINAQYENELLIDEIAAYLGISTNYFHSLFKNTLNESPKNYINKLRIEKAKSLLTTTNLAVERIGFECGFMNHVYFSYAFKKLAGVTATEYRRLSTGGY